MHQTAEQPGNHIAGHRHQQHQHQEGQADQGIEQRAQRGQHFGLVDGRTDIPVGTRNADGLPQNRLTADLAFLHGVQARDLIDHVRRQRRGKIGQRLHGQFGLRRSDQLAGLVDDEHIAAGTDLGRKHRLDQVLDKHVAGHHTGKLATGGEGHGHGHGHFPGLGIDVGLGQGHAVIGLGLGIPGPGLGVVVGRRLPVVVEDRLAAVFETGVHAAAEVTAGSGLGQIGNGIRTIDIGDLGRDQTDLAVDPVLRDGLLAIEQRIEFIVEVDHDLAAHLEVGQRHQHQAEDGQHEGIEGDQSAPQRVQHRRSSLSRYHQAPTGMQDASNRHAAKRTKLFSF